MDKLGQTLEDIFVTATEGGSGYWMGSVDVMKDAETESRALPGESLGECMARTLVDNPITAFINVFDAEDIDELLGTITMKSAKVALSSNIKLWNEVIEGDYDAETADLLVQYMTLGELVFG